LAGLVGCEPSQHWPAYFPASVYTKSQLGIGQKDSTPFEPPQVVRQQIDELLTQEYGTPENPKIKSASAERNRNIHKGSRIFRMHCMHCHGLSGAGNGVAAASFTPLPRDYRRGIFKWKTSPGAQKPTRDDLFRVISDGVPGTSMPSFKMLPAEQIQQLIEYVIFLSQRGEVEFRLLAACADAPTESEELNDFLEEDFADAKHRILKKVQGDWQTSQSMAVPEYVEPANLALREASIKRGRDLFLSAQANCAKCHGVDGKGRRPVVTDPAAPPVTDDKDVWGYPALPRDLNEGIYRGGRSPTDLFLRIHQGIGASNMPAFEKSLSQEQIWDLVRFVRALPYRPDLLPASSATSSSGS
jgi:mono/diheme cytochrome c family protein